MAYENTGTISKNKKKTQPKHPDITGKMTITEPGEYWISGWSRTGQSGPFYSLAFTKKGQKGESSGGPSTGAASKNDPIIDDDIPF